MFFKKKSMKELEFEYKLQKKKEQIALSKKKAVDARKALQEKIRLSKNKTFKAKLEGTVLNKNNRNKLKQAAKKGSVAFQNAANNYASNQAKSGKGKKKKNDNPFDFGW